MPGVELVVVDRGAQRPRYVRVPELEAAGVRHGISCREPSGHERAASGSDIQRLAEAIGLAALPRARLRQVHSADVRLAREATGADPPAGDALVCARERIALAILTADCVPLLVIAPAGAGLAAIHAGWRGTLAGVLPAAISRLARETGADPASLLVFAGPAIRACCYEVGDEIEAAFAARDPGASAWFHHPATGRPRLDLLAANAAQAVALGISASRFLDAGMCTRCRNDLFYSYRAEGPGTGRIVTLAGLS